MSLRTLDLNTHNSKPLDKTVFKTVAGKLLGKPIPSGRPHPLPHDQEYLFQEAVANFPPTVVLYNY